MSNDILFVLHNIKKYLKLKVILINYPYIFSIKYCYCR